MHSADKITQGVHVQVESFYMPERSNPKRGDWFFAYRIRIHNGGHMPAQLIARHWYITDANGQVSEVRGPGVVGEQPLLSPGMSFEYTSACPLQTPFGSMRGYYEMVRPDGTAFRAEIPSFTLAPPHQVN